MNFSEKEKIKTLQNSLYFERALFIVGPPNAGKSYQIRNMFRDIRFRNGGIPLPNNRRPGKINLSNERKLLLRIMSPQENGEDWEKFITKILKTAQSGRWNLVSAMQTDPTNMETDPSNKMPDLKQCIKDFISEFNPERIRVCFLSPIHNGDMLPNEIFEVTIPSLLRLDNRIECCTIDANHDHGLFLADFFDFT
ncbi:MAG: hypothetical protein IIC39_01790 [Candidatus Marinimicrobia bacterium]|nr:hypothetical protein [Candidatus Neomarinimicrobiota bacterium]